MKLKFPVPAKNRSQFQILLHEDKEGWIYTEFPSLIDGLPIPVVVDDGMLDWFERSFGIVYIDDSEYLLIYPLIDGNENVYPVFLYHGK